ncbi:MAG: hypothetical protein ABSA67_01720 [Candidatus Brocadiia bacterium]|jgi:hypothetical protein
MTIAISLKVNDGVILAADSATSIPAPGGQIINVYNNANKIFNLKKGHPVGAVAWGLGSIGQASITTLAKDFRYELTSGSLSSLISEGYTVERIATEFLAFLKKKHDEQPPEWRQNSPPLGLYVVGYSSNKDYAEEWQIQIAADKATGPTRIRKPDEMGVTWGGDGRTLYRLLLGYDIQLPAQLVVAGIASEQVNKVMPVIAKAITWPFVFPAMPIQDAIDLAEFLVYATAQCARFGPGAPIVGGPIEIAAITKHEGFKWVRRKHYFGHDLNPPPPV